MFKKKQTKLTWLLNQVTHDKEGQLKIIPAGVNSDKLTIDEMENLTIDAVKASFGQLRINSKKHDISVGTVVVPHCFVFFDDELKDDKQWQETKDNLNKLTK